ncbi:hypothetical protein GCM10011376_27790 [Nocardioides flavus (ex Wang et al. 2016)]|uniref:SurA N-terminal domain-containing protein n=1 Tax=Nocardioides flavus (ex Wang et al. 2016) TaxID=2058780 RepID=A0ABQ3HPS4_9ACTN|nr:hypothetical protein [Nocardioides flavus (ex Wang et al. 2016)]GHE18169.1 hypothetical protein GCM10011376_27790 [Nocardioides flavus (ex Wang et al. 2016)]
MSKTRLMTVATTCLAGLLLTGCGSASPGVAAKVGDEELTVRQIDAMTANYCTAVGDLESEVPMGFVRQYVVQLLTLRSQATQIADEYGVEAGSSYRNDVAQRLGTAGTQPEEVREDYVELASTTAYVQDILDQVGRIELEESGVSDPTTDQATQAGIDVFNQWPNANDIEIDPRYGLEVVDGVLSPVDTNTSVAVGETAKAGLGTEPDPAFARSLPTNHRCG